MSRRNGSFEIPGRTALLVFKGEYEGAEVRCRLQASLGLYMECANLTNTKGNEATREALQRFSEEVLIDWNLKLNGTKVPERPDGMLRIPIKMAGSILRAWSEAVEATPLAEGS